MAAFSYWIIMGTFYLILLTYKDIKNKMLVDDRHNYFMMGLTFSLLSIFKTKFWYIFLLIFITTFFIFYLNKRKVFGAADISTITWIFFGYAIINLGVLVWFFIIFIVIWAIYGVIKWIMAKYWLNVSSKTLKTPFFPVILITFILNNVLFKFYWT